MGSGAVPFNLGGGELVFILVIVLIVFGAGKLPDVFAQLGRGVRSFREESTTAASETKGVTAGSTTTSTAAAAKHCANCGNAVGADAKFCPNCGKPVA